MRIHLALSLFFTLAVPALAEPQDSSAIVVQGSRDRDKQIGDFIKDLTPAPVRGQLSRFETSVCPVATGLPARQNSLVTDRMRQVAQAADIPVGKPGCRPNVILIVTNDKSALLKHMAQHRPDYFPESWSGWHIRDVARDPAPVAAWQLEGQMWVDGRSSSQGSAASSSQSSGDFLSSSPKLTEMASRLRPLGRHAFFASVVVVQASALAGLTTTQLADYAAMRALVRTDPKSLRRSALDTILSVIDAPMGSAIPLTLTAWDLSFLKAFYASSKESYAEYQRAEMRRAMRRELDQNQ